MEISFIIFTFPSKSLRRDISSSMKGCPFSHWGRELIICALYAVQSFHKSIQNKLVFKFTTWVFQLSLFLFSPLKQLSI